MIKIRISECEATLNGRVWTCEEDKDLEEMLNRQTFLRPHRYAASVEKAIAHYIIDFFKVDEDEDEADNPVIIYDSADQEDDEAKKYDPYMRY